MARLLGGILVTMAATLGACAPSVRDRSPSSVGSLGWNMPWRLEPVSAASRARGEATQLGYVRGLGFVRGTPRALSYFHAPLASLEVRPGRNRTVDACREVVEAEARKLGAVRVEAATAGPERRTRQGYEGPVAVRILYRKQTGYEVRQSILTCQVDPRGRMIGAVVAQAV